MKEKKTQAVVLLFLIFSMQVLVLSQKIERKSRLKEFIERSKNEKVDQDDKKDGKDVNLNKNTKVDDNEEKLRKSEEQLKMMNRMFNFFKGNQNLIDVPLGDMRVNQFVELAKKPKTIAGENNISKKDLEEKTKPKVNDKVERQEMKPKVNDKVERQEMKTKGNGKVERQEMKTKGNGKVERQDTKPKGNGKVERQDTKPKGNDKIERQEMKPKGNDKIERQDTKPKGNDKVERQEMKPKGNDKIERQEMKPKGNDTIERQEMKPKGNYTIERQEMKPKGTDKIERQEMKPKGTDKIERQEMKPKGNYKVERQEFKDKALRQLSNDNNAMMKDNDKAINSVKKEVKNVPLAFISISTSTEVKTRQTVGQAKQAIDLASACVKSFFISVPSPFCFKKGLTKDIISPPLCDCGYFKHSDLCYQSCEIGWSFAKGQCWEDCPAGSSDTGVGCVNAESVFTSKKTKISYPKQNSDQVALCPYGYYKLGDLCYRDCASIGMINCNMDSCAVSRDQCEEGITNLPLDSVLGMSSLVLFLFSFGDSSNLPIGVLKESATKTFELLKNKGISISSYFKQIKKAPELYQAFLDRVTRKTKEFIVKGVSTMAVKEVCGTVCKELFNSIASAEEVNFNEESLDPDAMIKNVLSCGMDMSDESHRTSCANSIINYINFIDPLGLATIISTFLEPTCEI